MEWMAVYPDLYDINHYSILANYHQTYFPKICKLLLKGSENSEGSECDPRDRNKFKSPEAKGRDVYIRGDFGWPESDHYIDKGIDLSIAPYFLKAGDLSENLTAKQPRGSSLPRPPFVGPRPWLLHARTRNLPLTRGKLFYPWLASELSLQGGGGKKSELPGGLLSSWFNPKALDYTDYNINNEDFKKQFLNCEYKALKGMPVSSSCVGLGRTGYSVKLISCDQVNQKDFKPKVPTLDDFCPN